MKRVRIITSLLLVIAVMLSLIPLTLADDPATEPTEQPIPAGAPKVEIVGATIKNDDEFFEVGVKVSPENNGFLSTGVVLEYDRRLLVPVAWDKEGTEAVGADRTSWTQVASVPALCPSEISGKTAFAYNDKEDPNKGYLYLSAEAPVRLEKDKMPTGNVITVRFRYAGSGDTPEEQKAARQASKAAIMAKVGDPEPANTEAPTGTEAPATTDAPEVTEEPTNTEAPQGRDADEAESTEAPTGTEEPANTETPTGTQTPTATDAPDKFATGEGAIRLAPDEIAADSPAGQQVMYCTGDTETDSDNISDHVVEYYYTKDVDESKGIKYDHPMPAPTFSLVEIEAGSNAGSASAADFAALVFFDWDEKTLLGSATVGINSTPEQINSDIMTFTKTLVPPEMKPMLDNWDDDAAEACTTYDPEHPLTSHDGYTFGKWIEYASEAFTIYGDAVGTESAAVMETIGSPKGITEKLAEDIDAGTFNISGGVVLKTAYIANDKLDDLTESSNSAVRQYSIINDTEPGNAYYSRFGTATNYAVRFTIKRENDEGRAVHRARQTAVRAWYIANGVSVYTLKEIDNVDEQIVELAAPANATSMNLQVIDIGGVSNWVGAASRVDTKSDVPANYTYYGTIGYINEYISGFEENVESQYTAATMNTLFSAVGITTNSVHGTTGGANPRRQRAAYNIWEAQKAKIAAGDPTGTGYLSVEEMQNAITYGNYLGQ